MPHTAAHSVYMSTISCPLCTLRHGRRRSHAACQITPRPDFRSPRNSGRFHPRPPSTSVIATRGECVGADRPVDEVQPPEGREAGERRDEGGEARVADLIAPAGQRVGSNVGWGWGWSVSARARPPGISPFWEADTRCPVPPATAAVADPWAAAACRAVTKNAAWQASDGRASHSHAQTVEAHLKPSPGRHRQPSL